MIRVEINQKYVITQFLHWGLGEEIVENPQEITQWLQDKNIVYEWMPNADQDDSIGFRPFIDFENEKDAILFKMVWN